MTEDIPFLVRVGEESTYQIFKLDKNEVSIGSSKDATYNISSADASQCLVLISRHGDAWTVKDALSSNGIDLNGRRLVPLSPYILQDGDLLQFGAAASSPGQGTFEYKFCCAATREEKRELKESDMEPEQQLQKQTLPVAMNTKMEELEQKNKELKQQLRNQNLALEMILMDRKRDRESLLEEIKEKDKEKTEAQQQVVQVKEEVLSNFADLMDVTVQCSICTEYFVKATSLDCSHVFCSMCINEWMKIKKVCPNCRTPVTTLIQIPALDKCIDRMIDQFGEDIKGRRRELIHQRKLEELRTHVADASVLSALNAWLSARDRRMVTLAALMRAVAHSALAHTRPTAFRRTAALTRAEVMTHVHALGRSETARRAAELTKITVQTGAQALTKAKTLTACKVLAGAVALKRAVALTRAAAMSRSKALAKSATFRKAVAMAKAAAMTGANTLKKSALLRRATELASASAHQSSKVLTRSLVGRRAVALTRAVAHTVAEAVPRTPGMRRAVAISKATIKRAAALKRAHTLTRVTELMKTEALRKAVVVKRTVALIKAYAVAGVTTVKSAATYTRALTVIPAGGALLVGSEPMTLVVPPG